MSDLMSVSEYSKISGVSVQAIYQRIKSNKIEHEIKNGMKYIIVDNKENFKPTLKNNKADCKEIVKIYKTYIKDLKRQIKHLKKTKNKDYTRLENLFNLVMNNKGLTPVIEAKIIPDKKSKKKKKKKNKKK